MKKTLYLNVEDDVTKITTKVKAQRADEIVLVIPKNSYLFADSINLRLLKKQIEVLKRNVSILTMDEDGQRYAKKAGFALQQLPRVRKSNNFSDVRLPSSKSGNARTAQVEKLNNQDISSENLTESPVPIKKNIKRKKSLTRVVTPSVSSAKILKDRSAVSSETQSSLTDEEVVLPNTERLDVVESVDNVYMSAADTLGKPPKRKSFKKWMVLFVATSLAVILVLGLIILPGATVTITAEAQSVSRDLDVLVDSSIKNPDNGRLTLPAQKIDETRPASDTFTVNGKKEIGSKAEGRVALYNLTGTAMTLRASTTTLTVGSKSYSFKVDQTNVVPLSSPQNDSNATIADIIATDGGEDFNLPAGTRVEISNQSFGSQPQRLYATTTTQVVGGSSRFVSVLSQEDITKSQQELSKKVVAEINSGLEAPLKLVDGAYSVDVQDYQSSQPVDAEATSFTASSNVAIKGLAFNEQSLKEMVRQRLTQAIGEDKLLQSVESDVVVYKIKNLNIETGVMELSIHYESKALPVINERALLPDIVGKTQQEASDLILTNPDIDSVQIDLRPFWQRSLPRLSNKIQLVVKNSSAN